MIPVSQIWDEAVKLSGNCKADVVFRNINRAVEILANKSDWDPMTGFVDITSTDDIVTLPREIETPLTISYGHYPALGRDRLFRFHLNGPGDLKLCVPWRWWEDGPDAVTFKDLTVATLLAVTGDSADLDKVVWVYGYDENNRWIRHNQAGVMVDGYPFLVKTAYVVDGSAPMFSKITRVRKSETVGPVNLYTVTGGALDALIATYQWDDTEPVFRRLRLDRTNPNGTLVRIHFRRRNFEVRTQDDLIPLHNASAIVMMLRSLKYYDEIDMATAAACEVTAVRWLTEEQFTRNPPIMSPIQIEGPRMSGDDYLE